LLDKIDFWTTTINIAFGLAKLIHFYLITYFGNEIKVNSESLFRSIYESQWIDADADHKKLLTILMEQLKKPIVIVAFSVFDVTLENFLSVSC